jgi:hypothetical protein
LQVGKKMADYWEPSTKMLNDPTKFLDSLLTFDKDNIPESVIQKIEPYIGMENFTPEQVSLRYLEELIRVNGFSAIQKAVQGQRF